MSSFDLYQVLRKVKSNTIELLRWHFTTVLEGIFRRLFTKEKFKDPWEIKVKLSVHRSVFIEFYIQKTFYKREIQGSLGNKSEAKCS